MWCTLQLALWQLGPIQYHNRVNSKLQVQNAHTKKTSATKYLLVIKLSKVIELQGARLVLHIHTTINYNIINTQALRTSEGGLSIFLDTSK